MHFYVRSAHSILFDILAFIDNLSLTWFTLDH